MILVTGGAGFIGGNFVLDWLDQLKEDVVSLDLLTYAGNLENLSSLDNNPHHHFVQGNIGDCDLVPSLLKKYQVRAIINFAAESHVDRSILSPDAFIHTDVVGVYILLDESKNGPWDPSVGNFLAANQDVMKRFRIGPGRKVCTGFSGGADPAAFVASPTTGVTGTRGRTST